MRVGRQTGRNLVRALTLLMLLAPASGCGRKAKVAKHRADEAAAALAPTPDNTPVPVLRTPAGLVLKLDEPTAAAPVSPTNPAVTPTP